MQINVSGWGALALVLLAIAAMFAFAPETMAGAVDASINIIPDVGVSA